MTPGATEAVTPEQRADKVCSVCKIAKPVSAFKIQRQRGRPRSRCRNCDVEAMKAWRKTEAGKANTRKRSAARRLDPDYWEWWKGYLARTREKPINRAREVRHAQRYRLKYPDKRAAHRAVRQAVEAGLLIRPETCEKCAGVPKPNRLGRALIHAHHDDYSQPLAVRWLCADCHADHHSGEQT